MVCKTGTVDAKVLQLVHITKSEAIFFLSALASDDTKASTVKYVALLAGILVGLVIGVNN